MIKFEKIQAGMILYDLHKYRMGHTTMSSWGVWTVQVISVNPEERTAIVSWNGNPPQRWRESQLCKLRAKKPEMVENCMGQQHPKRREKKSKPA